MTIEVVGADDRGLALAARRLATGGLVIHPTETVVSLSGDPRSEGAVRRARTLKGYAEPRPFLVLVRDIAAARELAGAWPEAAGRLAESLWPGPVTLVLEAAPDGPAPVIEEGRLAVRPASDPISLALLTAFGGPVFSTSANRRDRVSPATVEEAIESLAAGFDAERLDEAIVPIVAIRAPAGGRAAGSTPLSSTIVDVTVDPPRLVRRGAIPVDRIREVVSGTLGE